MCSCVTGKCFVNFQGVDGKLYSICCARWVGFAKITPSHEVEVIQSSVFKVGR